MSDEAREIAIRWLDKGDYFGTMAPDGDECVVARWYLRSLEENERLRAAVKNAIEAIECGSTTAPVLECLRSALEQKSP
jgi:hypothetical protein